MGSGRLPGGAGVGEGDAPQQVQPVAGVEAVEGWGRGPVGGDPKAAIEAPPPTWQGFEDSEEGS